MKLLLLTKDNIPLAKAEAEALLSPGKLDENILLINTKKTTDRLAFTRIIANVLFEATEKTIEAKINKFNWNKIIKKTFGVSFRSDEQVSQSLSKEYGGMIYDCLKKPKVNLDNPGTKIIIFKTNNKLYVTIPEWENDSHFEERNPKNRPAQRPITIQPRVGKICVNLTGATKELYDPFCGVGGFLIEAGLMGLKIIGSDNDASMVRGCKRNLEFYKLKNFKLFVQDATKINKKMKYVLADLPYGRNTKNISKTLYPNFIKILEKQLTKRAVLIFPNYAHVEKLLKKSKLKIKGKYSYYIHGSLTREIFVLEK